LKEIKKLLYIYFIVDFILLVISYFIGGVSWLINSQVAFLTSLIVTLASFDSYKKMIEARVANGEVPIQRDELDEIDDKFELFEEEESLKDHKDIFKEEKKKALNMRQSITNLKKSSPAIFSFKRVGSYGLLFIGFISLAKSSLFIITPYLIGLLIVPFVSSFSFLIIKNKE